MIWPWVSRARLDGVLEILRDYRERVRDLEDQNMRLVEKIVEIKVDPLTVSAAARKEQREDTYVLPEVVQEAIRERSIAGSSVEIRLKKFAEGRLANGDAEPKEVAEEILMGSDAFKNEDW